MTSPNPIQTAHQSSFNQSSLHPGVWRISSWGGAAGGDFTKAVYSRASGGSKADYLKLGARWRQRKETAQSAGPSGDSAKCLSLGLLSEACRGVPGALSTIFFQARRVCFRSSSGELGARWRQRKVPVPRVTLRHAVACRVHFPRSFFKPAAYAFGAARGKD